MTTIERITISAVIFILAAVSSTVSNRLYYAMYDHHATRAGILAFVRECLQWTVQVYIYADLFISRTWWTAIYILADAAGDAWRTFSDCRRHGRAG